MTEQEHEEDLGLEVEQIHDIVRCAQHPQMILSGRHRFQSMNKKGKTARARLADCDKIADRLNISHDEAHWWVIRKANKQRTVPEEEQITEMVSMAEAAKQVGILPGEIVGRLAKALDLSERRIQQLLPSDYKRAYEKQEPEFSPKGENRNKGQPEKSVSQHTQAAQLLESAFSYYSLHPDNDYKNFPRGEFTGDGKEKSYTPDFWFEKEQLIVEVEGEGSSSKDNQKRDEFFRNKGIKVVHLSNRHAQSFSGEIASLVAALVR